MPIAKKQSNQDESLFLQEACFWSICLKNEWFYDSSHMDEDENNDISYGELCQNVGI